MLNQRLARDAFRARALSLVVATTGDATLAATTVGYTRAAGSFISDGFRVGQEVAPTGFTQTAPGVIQAVTATLLTIVGGRTAQAAGASRSLTVGLPALRAWENVALTPSASRPWIEEHWVPGGSGVITIPARTGLMVEDGLSRWNWYGVAGVGSEALDDCTLALMKLFTAGTGFALGDSTTVTVRTDTTVKRSDARRIDSWSVVTVTIPWRVKTRNVVAA